jgi:hypothetical protein
MRSTQIPEPLDDPIVVRDGAVGVSWLGIDFRTKARPVPRILGRFFSPGEQFSERMNIRGREAKASARRTLWLLQAVAAWVDEAMLEADEYAGDASS